MKYARFTFLLLTIFALMLAACGPTATPTPTAPPPPPATTEAPMVTETPAPTETMAPAALKVTGSVAAEQAWSEDEVKAMPTMTAESVNSKGEKSSYTGVSIAKLLAAAQPNADATAVTFVADDGSTAETSLYALNACADCIVSFRNNGGFSVVMPFFPSAMQLKGVVEIQLAAKQPAAPANPTLILATTTSTQDSGLLDVLVPLFEQATGYTVQTVAVGTGAALKMAEEGNADVLLVHAPASEKALMDAGWGNNRYLVMHNDFVIVGPAADPAGIKGAATAVEAFQKVADAGANFVTRGDDSGTNKMEISLWGKTTATPAEPWYINSGQGMGATLTIASEKAAYTLTDRATYLANKANLSLDILVEGDPGLLNVYHTITVNPDKWPKSNYEAAMAFAGFMSDPAIQAVIGQFGVDKFGQPLFFPDADKTDAELGLP